MLVLWSGMELLFPVMEVWSLNHWTSRECPYFEFSENQLSIIAVKRAKQNETQFNQRQVTINNKNN